MPVGKGYAKVAGQGRSGPEVLTIGVGRERGRFAGVGPEKVSVTVQRDERGQFSTRGTVRRIYVERPAWSAKSERVFVDSLDSNERSALDRWFGEDSEAIRSYQATGDPGIGGQAIIEASNRIEETILRAPRFEGNVYRGLRNLSVEQVEKLERGDLGFNAMASATADEWTAMNNVSGVNGALLTLRTKSGADLRDLNPFEAEVLLPRGVNFRLLSVRREKRHSLHGDGILLHAEYEEVE